jgi:hypothetical protein
MKKYLIIIFLLPILAVNAQELNKLECTGSKHFDAELYQIEQNNFKLQDQIRSIDRKSPFLASVLSFAVPGAGDIYNGNYWRAALFLAVEAAAVSIGVAYDQKGDDQTDKYQDFAHQHWSVEKYAEWTINFAQNLGVDDSYFDVYKNGKVSWNKLHQLENQVSSYEPGRYYSHNLEEFGEQQYYEMIGKYTQFTPGWDDFEEDGTYNSVFNQTTKNFDDYSHMRGKANDYYNIASKSVIVVVTNHIIAAVEAALSANAYNKSLEMDVSLNKAEYGFYSDIYPELNMKINF